MHLHKHVLGGRRQSCHRTLRALAALSTVAALVLDPSRTEHLNLNPPERVLLLLGSPRFEEQAEEDPATDAGNTPPRHKFWIWARAQVEGSLGMQLGRFDVVIDRHADATEVVRGLVAIVVVHMAAEPRISVGDLDRELIRRAPDWIQCLRDERCSLRTARLLCLVNVDHDIRVAEAGGHTVGNLQILAAVHGHVESADVMGSKPVWRRGAWPLRCLHCAGHLPIGRV